MLPRRVSILLGLLSVVPVAVPRSTTAQTTPVPAHHDVHPAAQSPAAASPAVLTIDGLGKGAAPIDGLWQFHLGDDPAFALPETPDATGSGGWEQLSADEPWGAQGHRSYTGYAWYRKHLSLTTAPGASPELYFLIRHIEDVYEVYWNGQLVGHHGVMPPHPGYPFSEPPQILSMGPGRDGVLAIRVWKAPLISFDTGLQGGFLYPPLVGSLAAVNAHKTENDYDWLRSRQYYFAMQSLYGLIMVLSLLAWLRNRNQPVLLAMALFSGMPAISTLLVGLRLPLSYTLALGLLQPTLSLEDIGLWFLLLYLLELNKNERLTRFAWKLATVSIVATSLDGLLSLLDWSKPWIAPWVQGADGVLTLVFTVTEAFPLVLVALAIGKRLDLARWLMAITAFLVEMLLVIRIAVSQGSRFTHWTLGEKIAAPLFSINGNPFTAQTIADTLLLFAIIYAVYHYMRQTLRRQGALEQELKSARELQQILIPETLPELPGFAVSSAYHPAQEVGGDFFQIIPLEGEYAGSTLILLGDVSGKGLKAAMTVSLIVGVVRTLARFVQGPAELLAELNQRLYGRLQGGFTTCLALRLDPDGRCVLASAGHPAPFLNQREIPLPGALPLGVVPGLLYTEREIDIREGDHFALYTDGLLEARSASGEIFSFERLHALFAKRPGAAEASEAAVQFGQEDDITVLTLTRLSSGQRSTTELTVPMLTRA